MQKKFNHHSKKILTKRKHLRAYMTSVCFCKGYIATHSIVKTPLGYGIFKPKKQMTLLKKLRISHKKYNSIRPVLLDHIWIEDKDLFIFPRGANISFNASVYPYRKLNGVLSFGLGNIEDIHFINNIKEVNN